MSSTASETADIQPKPRRLMPVLLAASLPLMVFLKMGFFFLVIGMLPTLLAATLMRRSKDYVLSTITAFNFAGVFPDLLGISAAGGTASAVIERLSNVPVWASMYGAALLGWAIVWLSPAIAMLFLEAFYKGRMRQMENIQKKLEDEWGPAIREPAKH